MKVRELLKQLAPTIKTHEFVTLTNAPTKLIIDIEHCYKFHAVGYITKHNAERTVFEESLLTSPFDNSYYKFKNKYYSVLDDFEVYRWKLNRVYEDSSEYIWKLEIETKQYIAD